MPFRIAGLPSAPFRPLFDLPDAELATRGIHRRVADAKPGFPCRVSLEDADVGEEVLLLPFEHHAVDSPYRASGAIYVRRGATESFAGDNAIPEQLRLRLLSVRAYDAHGMMRGADVCAGEVLEPVIERFLADPGVAYLHIHNAKPGCFACKVERRA